MLEDFDFTNFWEDSDYARESYVEGPITPDLIRSVELELGFRLPAAYVALMRVQNGGMPSRSCFPTTTPTSWAEDHVAVTGIFGIGRDKPCALLGGQGSKFMQSEWGYPTFGICICDCPSAGHDMIMLDYRACGPKGEPSVVHVDQERGYRVTFLAPDFETFLRGLVPESDFDTSKEDLEAVLEAALEMIEKSAFSAPLAKLVAVSAEPAMMESGLRGLLRAIAVEKSYFVLHTEEKSYLVYDVLFDLYASAHLVKRPEAFLHAYPDLIALCSGINTGGYAPAFVEGWMKKRMKAEKIIERDGRLVIVEAHRKGVMKKLAKFAA